MQDHDAFSSRAAPPGGAALDWLIFLDPPAHTRLRALISRTFTPRAIAGLEPRIETIVDDLLAAVIHRGSMDLMSDFAVPLPLRVIGELLGLPAADRSSLLRWSNAILHLGDAIHGGARRARAIDAHRAATAEMQPYVAQLVAQRRVTPRADLLSRLAEAEVDGEQLADAEILGFFELLLLAGTETTSNLIGNAMITFLEFPEQMERVRRAPELLPAAIEEVLRFRTPVQMIFRSTTRAVQIRGRTIPAGKLVLPMIGSANRDPRHFPNAGRFDIMRAPTPHLAFGHGVHFCIGSALARLEARVALTALLQQLDGVRLVTRRWETQSAVNVYGAKRLLVSFERVGRPR